MIVLLAAVFGSGIVTAAIFLPISPLAALVVTPFVASFMAVLVGFYLARLQSKSEWTAKSHNVQAEAEGSDRQSTDPDRIRIAAPVTDRRAA